MRNIRELLSICTKLVYSDAINLLTIKLKQETRIKLPDALIASTSIHYNLPLLTFDRDFSRVNNLELILLE